MSGRWKEGAIAVLAFSLGFLLWISPWHSQSVLGQQQPVAMGQDGQMPAPKTAAEVYKNIRVLKNIPAYELIPTMEFISASLGVHCEFCHVMGHFARDTKKTKRRARAMMRMMFAIDKTDFQGHLRVTCETCHDGSPHPASVPPIAEASNRLMLRPAHFKAHHRHFNVASLPRSDAIIAKYVTALGGADALRSIKSRVITGTMTFFGHTVPITIYAKAPDMQATVMKFPRGEGLQIYNGHEGWAAIRPRPAHRMEGSELDEARLNAEFYFPLEISKNFNMLRERPPEKVDGKEAYLLLGLRPGKPPVKLYFDEQSGLLVRTVYFTQTALGLLPQQTDYADYREVNGVKVPFRTIIAEPQEHSTVQVEKIEQNVPISAERFQIPAHGPSRM